MKNQPARKKSVTEKTKPTKIWKIAYFRIRGLGENNDHQVQCIGDSNPVPTLEICLLPIDDCVQTMISDGKTELLSVPKSQKVLHLKAGDLWPGDVPETLTDLIRQQFKGSETVEVDDDDEVFSYRDDIIDV